MIDTSIILSVELIGIQTSSILKTKSAKFRIVCGDGAAQQWMHEEGMLTFSTGEIEEIVRIVVGDISDDYCEAEINGFETRLTLHNPKRFKLMLKEIGG